MKLLDFIKLELMIKFKICLLERFDTISNHQSTYNPGIFSGLLK